MQLTQQGRPVDEVIAELRAKRSDDVRWAEGRAFSLVYDGGPSVHDVAEQAARLFLHENALNTIAFPSLGQIQSEVVSWTTGLLHGPETAAGFLTSGGTESIQCAVLAARERGRAERGITEPEIVVAESAHAAFHKSAHLFGMRIVTTAVLPDWTADVDAMAAAVGPNTVLVVGSAPQYPQGVVDPIPEIAALAATVGANCHVDACMGGFVLPFAELLGRDVPAWDFRVDGVHSISADIHKLGYAPKGVSVIVHRTKQLRAYQTFVFDRWLGGFYASPNLQGSRSGLPMAAAWAVMQHLGSTATSSSLVACSTPRPDARRHRRVDGLRVLGDAGFHIVAMAADPSVDVFASATRCAPRLVPRPPGPSDSLHATVSNSNVGVIDDYLADLTACRADGGEAARGPRTTYATLE